MNFTKTILNGIKYWVENKFSKIESDLSKTQSELEQKQPAGNYVIAVEGKGLSTEDYTTEEKEQLEKASKIEIIEIDSSDYYSNYYNIVKQAYDNGKTILIKYKNSSDKKEYLTPYVHVEEDIFYFCFLKDSLTITEAGYQKNGDLTRASTNLENSLKKLKNWNPEKTGSEDNYPSIKAMEEYVGENKPVKVSELENDAGYLTEHQDLSDYALKTELPSTEGLASETYVDNKVSGQISVHNTAVDSHNDIRDLINGLTTRLNALADSDDTTLDQLSEIVTYIKSNKTLIENVTTNKVNVSDIIDNLTTNVSTKPLSAAQGVELKALIDTLQNNIDTIDIPVTLADLTDDADHRTVTDAEKATWNAKSDFSGSWDDLTDKPFYDESITYTVCENINENGPMSSFAFQNGEGKWGDFYFGDEVLLVFNGVEYRGVISDRENSTTYNKSYFVDFYSNEVNESICELCVANTTRYSRIWYKLIYQGAANFSVYIITKRIKTIDSDCLPTTVPVIQSAQVGQTVVVKTVDENGVPTEWEAIEVPEGFSGSWDDLTNKPTNVSAFTNDAGYITDYTETDPTVPAWAKEANKPTYSASEVGAYSKSEIDNMVFITVEDIDAICGANIVVASEVEF